MTTNYIALFSVVFLVIGSYLFKKGFVVISLRFGFLGFLLLGAAEGWPLLLGDSLGLRQLVLMCVFGIVSFLFIVASFLAPGGPGVSQGRNRK